MSAVRIAGYAALFDRMDRGGDTIRGGAFARSLQSGRTLPLLWEHDPAAVIGRVDYLSEDRRGLRMIATLHPDAPVLNGKSLRPGRDHERGLSFGYRARRSVAGPAPPGQRRRELLDLDLVEISLVAVPMMPGARVHLVALR